MAKKTADSNGGVKTVGKNIAYTLEGSTLTMVIDLSKDFGPSNSGKTLIIASTEGSATIGGVKVGVNVFKYKEEKAKK